MIPTLIAVLIKRYRTKHPEQFNQLLSKALYSIKIILFILIGCCIALAAKAQENNLVYEVKRNGNKIGRLLLKEIKTDNRTSYKLESEIKTRLLFTFTANAIEEAIYENGVLLYSFIYRKLNGSEKANKKTKSVGNSYIITSNGNEERLGKYPIRYNMVCLYTQEPVNIKVIFSDNFQKFIAIQKIADHHYKIVFPDGSSNEYWYADGLCIKILIEHNFYTAIMELKK